MAKRKVKDSAVATLLMVSVFSPLSISYAQRNRSSNNGGHGSATTTAAAAAAAPASDARGAAEQITAADLKEYLYFVAADEMEGRDTPSRGLDLTAKFLAMNLALAGLKPAGDNGTYFQRFVLPKGEAEDALPSQLPPGDQALPGMLTTQNVVAILEGSDPILKNEYVAVGAHYDHVGLGAQVGGDAIYNGADDDGSGTVAVLAMAQAFARSSLRPKRSILFVWHAGEEKGLWGSRYFTEHPSVPIKSIITQLNIDMIGRSKKEDDAAAASRRGREVTGTNEIYVIGSRLMSTALGNLSESVNRAYLNLKFNYLYDNPRDPNRLFFRSDHFNYARKGIPIIFYFDGIHEDYHQPGDSADKIDYAKMERVTRTIFMTAWELAQAPKRPLVDKVLPSGIAAAAK